MRYKGPGPHLKQGGIRTFPVKPGRATHHAKRVLSDLLHSSSVCGDIDSHPMALSVHAQAKGVYEFNRQILEKCFHLLRRRVLPILLSSSVAFVFVQQSPWNGAKRGGLFFQSILLFASFLAVPLAR